MKKILRVFFRIIIVMSMVVFTIMTLINISKNKEIPSVFGIIIYLTLISITIVLSIILLSNPTRKISFRKKVKINKNKKTLEFQEICNNLMIEYGESLDSYRKKGILFIIFVICGLILTFLLSLLKLNFKVVFILGGVITILPVTLYLINKKRYKDEFKRKIMPIIIKEIDQNLQYSPEGNNNMINQYNLLFPNNDDYNSVESTDYIYGKKNNVPLEICKISLANYSENSGEKINILQTFLFTHNKLDFSVSNKFTIKPNNLINRIKNKKVEMDSNEFEKYFDVFSDSDMLAMQILTHDVMEELIYFRMKFGCKFEIVINNDDIYIKFNTGEVFMPKVFTKITDSDFLWTYYTILNFITNLCVRINKALEGTAI